MLTVKILGRRRNYTRYLARIRETLWRMGFSELVEFVFFQVKERRPLVILEADEFGPQVLAWWRGRLPSARQLASLVWVGDYTH